MRSTQPSLVASERCALISNPHKVGGEYRVYVSMAFPAVARQVTHAPCDSLTLSPYAAAAAPTTEVDQSITEEGRTMWRLRPSSLGSSPSASPTSWGRCRIGISS